MKYSVGTEKQIGLIFQHVARLRSRYYDQKLAQYGLTSTQALALNALMREDGLTQVELARLLGIGKVAVGGLIDRLEAHDLVIRKVDSRDLRSKRVWLQPTASDKKASMTTTAREVNEAAMAGLEPQEVEQLISMMHRIRDNLRGALKDSAEDGADVKPDPS